MVLLKALLGLLIGAVVGFIGGFILSIVLWIVVGIATWNSRTGENVASVAFLLIWLACAAIGFVLPLVRTARRRLAPTLQQRVALDCRLIFMASIIAMVVCLVDYYPATMSGGGLSEGMILGALAGAGIGAIVPQFKVLSGEVKDRAIVTTDCLAGATLCCAEAGKPRNSGRQI